MARDSQRDLLEVSYMQGVHLWLEVLNEISWKFSAVEKYFANSGYEAHFLGSTKTNFDRLILNVWAPPKCKFSSGWSQSKRLCDRFYVRARPNKCHRELELSSTSLLIAVNDLFSPSRLQADSLHQM